MQCIACPMGSSATDDSGVTHCVQESPNLIQTGLKVLGYLFGNCQLVFSSRLYYIWMLIHRKDSVVKIGQPEFLLFICVGAIMSTSPIILLTPLADSDVGEYSVAASRSCQTIPFLYSLGWVLMYLSIMAKLYQLTKVAASARHFTGGKVTAKEMYKIIAAFMVLDLIFLIAWQVVDPLLMYIRSEVTNSVNDDSGVVTIETVGQCTSNLFWIAIIGIHVCLMVITNILLLRVRNLSDRYQEQKYVALASLYICELLLLGIPILNCGARFCSRPVHCHHRSDLPYRHGVLSLIFIPKIKFQNEGLPEGMSVVQSMNIQSSVQIKATVTQVLDTHGSKYRLDIGSSAENLGNKSVYSSAEFSGKIKRTGSNNSTSKDGSSGRQFSPMSFSSIEENDEE